MSPSVPPLDSFGIPPMPGGQESDDRFGRGRGKAVSRDEAQDVWQPSLRGANLPPSDTYDTCRGGFTRSASRYATTIRSTAAASTRTSPRVAAACRLKTAHALASCAITA